MSSHLITCGSKINTELSEVLSLYLLHQIILEYTQECSVLRDWSETGYPAPSGKNPAFGISSSNVSEYTLCARH